LPADLRLKIAFDFDERELTLNRAGTLSDRQRAITGAVAASAGRSSGLVMSVSLAFLFFTMIGPFGPGPQVRRALTGAGGTWVVVGFVLTLATFAYSIVRIALYVRRSRSGSVLRFSGVPQRIAAYGEGEGRAVAVRVGRRRLLLTGAQADAVSDGSSFTFHCIGTRGMYQVMSAEPALG